MKTILAAQQTNLDSVNPKFTTGLQVERVNLEPEIVDVTKANPGVIETRYPHEFSVGDVFIARGVVGMTQLNGNQYVVASIVDTTHFEIDQDTTSFGVYSSDGVANRLFGFTSYDASFQIDKLSYIPDVGYMPSELRSSGDLSVNNVDVTGIIDNDIITENDLVSGRFDFCRLWFFGIDPTNIANDPVTIGYGRIGEVNLNDFSFNAEFRGLSQALTQDTMRQIMPSCDVEVGSTKCGVDIEALAVVGTVTNVANKRTFEDTSLTQDDGYFSLGVVRWLTGNNTGRRVKIRQHQLSGTLVTLLERVPFTIQIGDTYSITPGCGKSAAICETKYSNIVNFRGFNFLPGMAEMFDYGIRK